MTRKRYVIIGTGSRCRMFLDAIAGPFRDTAELVGFCDTSASRMRTWNQYLASAHQLAEVPVAGPDGFESLLKQARADVVIITSVDATHHTYIVRAMHAGCDAITEKPMTTDESKMAAIFKAIEVTGRSLRVAFNYRWQPTFSLIKEVVASGRIGRPTLVDFQWRLDTSHGADYFRRWHRQKQHSGGLLVHKATHHFDLVNWILDDQPEQVFAFGGLEFYGRDNAESRGISQDYDRYTGRSDAQSDPFALDLATDDEDGVGLKSLYLDAEDTLSVTARYRRGTLLNYSLIAYCPWEGERLCVTGTEGQIEYFGRGSGHVITGQSDKDLAAQQYQGERYVRLQRQFQPPEELTIPEATGAHGGGDARLLERLFRHDAEPDPLHRDATHLDGAWSVLTGVAANRSIETGQPVELDDLFCVRA